MGPDRTRRPSAKEAADEVFKKKVTAPSDPVPKKPSIPGVKEQISLAIDQDVLEYFQADGPGWQNRINEALRKAAGK